tara:strand:- start:1293 stop:1640 length:348 start_codon:yes stop_codon:yes gene_type:complete
MSKGNLSVNVRMNDNEKMALDYLVKIGGFGDRSEAMREFMYIFTEAVIVTHETEKAWKGVWQVMKGMKRLNERFDKVSVHADKYKKEDLFNQPDEQEFLTVLKDALQSRTTPVPT